MVDDQSDTAARTDRRRRGMGLFVVLVRVALVLRLDRRRARAPGRRQLSGRRGVGELPAAAGVARRAPRHATRPGGRALPAHARHPRGRGDGLPAARRDRGPARRRPASPRGRRPRRLHPVPRRSRALVARHRDRRRAADRGALEPAAPPLGGRRRRRRSAAARRRLRPRELRDTRPVTLRTLRRARVPGPGDAAPAPCSEHRRRSGGQAESPSGLPRWARGRSDTADDRAAPPGARHCRTAAAGQRHPRQRLRDAHRGASRGRRGRTGGRRAARRRHHGCRDRGGGAAVPACVRQPARRPSCSWAATTRMRRRSGCSGAPASMCWTTPPRRWTA